MSNENFQSEKTNEDRLLWEIAQKRASFKSHLVAYVLVVGILWGIWFITHRFYNYTDHSILPWPSWTTIGWGIGLALHFVWAYVFPNASSAEREYQKLKSKQ